MMCMRTFFYFAHKAVDEWIETLDQVRDAAMVMSNIFESLS